MQQNTLSDAEMIRQVIQQINDLWMNKRYSEIGELLMEQAVIAPSLSSERIRGREAYVQSYRAYDQVAKTLEFSSEEPEIDIMGDVAVAVCPFFVKYELEHKTHSEKGRDILVFSRSADEWKVAWRTMQFESAEKKQEK